MDEKQKKHLLKRGVAEIIVEEEFVNLMNTGKPLRLKMGFDPSAPDLHLGHAVGLRKLRQLQDMGHKVVVIVGDWTAQIGDPTGQSATRPMLTKEEVMENAQTYLTQFFKIVDKDRTETRLQSDWFGEFSLADVIKLTSRFTVAQFLARDDFAKRYKSNHPIAITELLYPLLQAYDSIAVKSDVEFGGTDQRFNLLVGRDLQQMIGQRAQQCFLMPLIPGTDGSQKMSKSLNNYISVTDPPNEMYLKTMRLPDFVEAINPSIKTQGSHTHGKTKNLVNGNLSLILLYFECLTDMPNNDLEEMRLALENDSVNPMELKKLLARELVTQFHTAKAAVEGEKHFEHTVQQRRTPEDIGRYALSIPSGLFNKKLSHLLVDTGLVNSLSEARRLIGQGAVRINDEPVKTNLATEVLELQYGDVIGVGRSGYIKLVAPNS